MMVACFVGLLMKSSAKSVQGVGRLKIVVGLGASENKQKAKDCEKLAMQLAFRPNCLPVPTSSSVTRYATVERPALWGTFETFGRESCQLPEIEQKRMRAGRRCVKRRCRVRSVYFFLSKHRGNGRAIVTYVTFRKHLPERVTQDGSSNPAHCPGSRSSSWLVLRFDEGLDLLRNWKQRRDDVSEKPQERRRIPCSMATRTLLLPLAFLGVVEPLRRKPDASGCCFSFCSF